MIRFRVVDSFFYLYMQKQKTIYPFRSGSLYIQC